MKNRHTSKAKGFTLLEVLVALAILAITMAALIKGAGTSASNSAYLRDRSIAHWVGMNVVTGLQLAETWPEIGQRQGDEEMARQRWHWQADVSETFDANVRRVDVRVSAGIAGNSSNLVTLVAFLPRKEPVENTP